MRQSTPAVLLQNVSFAYIPVAPVLENFSLRVDPGERVAVVGPNGSGKTTLLNLLLGLLQPTRGSIEILGSRPEAARDRLGYVPQCSKIDLSVPATVLDVVLMGYLRRARWGPRFHRDLRNRARDILSRLGLAGFASRSLGELSGGQRRRVLIARALVAEPQLLLMDEPTSGLDAENRQKLLDLPALRDRTLVVVSHNPSWVADHFDRRIVMGPLESSPVHGAPASPSHADERSLTMSFSG